MLDIKFVRENPEVVKENMRKKFQDEKLGSCGEVNFSGCRGQKSSDGSG